MRIGLLVPTRGDRPTFLNFARTQISRQTLQPDVVEIVDDAPLDLNSKDITWRYRLGCERLLAKDIDVILLWEDDDYYSVDYIRYMVSNWQHVGSPNIFGIGETTYYHLGIKGFNRQSHPTRASAMSTLLSADGARGMKWPADNFVFTDIELWKHVSGQTIMPSSLMTLGIKGYKEGALFGGMGHAVNNSLYGRNLDPEMEWMKSNVDEFSFDFYKSVADSL